MLTYYTRKKGKTVSGESLLRLDTRKKRYILQKVKKQWEDLIELQFSLEAGVFGSIAKPWEALTPEYEKRKIREGWLPGILEKDSDRLADRYKDEIVIQPATFSILMNYPQLTGNTYTSGISAEIHQQQSEREDLPVRPLGTVNFTKIATKVVSNYLKRN